MSSSKDSGSGNNNENRNNENNGSNSITILSPVRRSPSSPAVVFRVPLDDNIVEPMTTPIFNYVQQPINSAIIPSPLTLWRLYHPVSPPPLGYYSPRPLSPLYDRYTMYPCITPYMARFIHGHEYHRMVSPIRNHIISGLSDNPTSSAPPTNPHSANPNHINAVGEDGDNGIAEAGPSSTPRNNESDEEEDN